MDIKRQLEVIKRGIAELISEEELIDKLKRKKCLRIKLGLDPTAPDIHLGHTVVLNKLRQFQDLGHQVFLIIGDFTARIGDPSGRSDTRPQLSDAEIKWNAATYMEQAFKILDESKTKVVFNSEWLDKMSIMQFAALGAKQTVARMLERDDFKKRYEEGTDISILEFFYPLMQAQDSVELKADVEIGGTDQKFNLIMGRTIQKRSGQESQIVLTLPLLVGTDGVRKMSKSYGNYIGISENPHDIFGKIMSISDDLMWSYYELLSQKTLAEIAEIKKQVQAGKLHPKLVKEQLALEIVGRFYAEDDANQAKQHFDQVIVQKQKPSQIAEFTVDGKGKKTFSLVDALAQTELVSSKSELRRLINQGGVSIDGKKITELDTELSTNTDHDIKIGKRKFVRILFK
ncbi:MAG: tyrosine--tRNA ligase [Pseudomonadota bacterium]